MLVSSMFLTGKMGAVLVEIGVLEGRGGQEFIFGIV